MVPCVATQCPVKLTKREASEVIQDVYDLHDQGVHCFDVARIVSIILSASKCRVNDFFAKTLSAKSPVLCGYLRLSPLKKDSLPDI